MARHGAQAHRGEVFRSLIEYVLGVRCDYKGFLIDPFFSAELKDVSVVRKFRGSEYRISIDNKDGRCKHANEIFVDGKKIQGNILPI